MQKITVTLSRPLTTKLRDLIDLGETEESMLERAEKLHERHLKLLEENEDYAVLYNSLPDRSDFVSGVPIVENSVVPAMLMYNRMITVQSNRAMWRRNRDKNYIIRVINGKRTVIRRDKLHTLIPAENRDT